MDAKDFANGILELELSFDNFEISNNETKINYWYNYFKNIDNETFIKGVREYITTEKYKPTICGLFESIKKCLKNNNETTISNEWNKVLKLLLGKNLNKLRVKEELGENSITFKALEKVGISRIKKSFERELPFLLNEFKECYQQLEENKINYDLKNGLIGINSKKEYLKLQ
ncbi:hypothetical protein [Helcococcus kunzii]|uniref:hypothetical protein n=1 Tax=Helcococcus kunzii TaxID=40091 RepID=UPI0024AD2AF0|nr:hypothetical protein [Helcococcus kunzii]